MKKYILLIILLLVPTSSILSMRWFRYIWSGKDAEENVTNNTEEDNATDLSEEDDDIEGDVDLDNEDDNLQNQQPIGQPILTPQPVLVDNIRYVDNPFVEPLQAQPVNQAPENPNNNQPTGYFINTRKWVSDWWNRKPNPDNLINNGTDQGWVDLGMKNPQVLNIPQNPTQINANQPVDNDVNRHSSFFETSNLLKWTKYTVAGIISVYTFHKIYELCTKRKRPHIQDLN